MGFVVVAAVSKVYGSAARQVHALRSVSLEVADGEMCAIVGPSGSGKTTLLSLLGAFDRPTSGRICVGGADLAMLGARAAAHFRRAKIGFIFQAYNLVPVLTAAENIALPLSIQRIARAERHRRVDALLEELRLRDLAGLRPAELSGGQQQRVAIARALVTEPQLVLADEPTAHLDEETALEVMAVVRRLNAVRRTTFLFSTHDPTVEAAARVRFHLRSGKLVQETAEERATPCRNFCASHCATYAGTRAVH